MVENDIPSKATSVFPRRMVMTTDGPLPYLVHSGRFGISHDEIEQIETLSQRAANRIAEDLQGNTVLVLGHGENIYIPSRVAAKLQEAGFSVMFKTTSRTPIFVDEQIIKDAETFMDRGVRYHFYNREEAEEFDNVILLADTPFHAHLCNKLRIYDL
ncbi:TRSP domain-containing protein [Segatella bryantii]|uniref:TRSP domain-containing protein n=1 Tax=Segatella bryantii TaxID=77095 RepID=UPI001ED9E5E1|nr:TRSP domain-containing protein [Segatella bryantii]UKK76216.1 TRSP domain-containing protein [Segatella bryantii]